MIASSDAVFEYLLRFVNVERGQATEFKLDRMEALAAALGHPERGRLSVHVAGSKGKGSVSAMIARIFEASGMRCGLYVSPHLLRWKERMTLAGDQMPEAIILDAFNMVRPLLEGKSAQDYPGGEEPTYFELTTLVAFCAFYLARCDAQVIETGLGGRLDSTNIIQSDLAVITPIELEHTQFLGDTLGAIAREKAGIIKYGKAVCLSGQRDEAMRVFVELAAERDAPLYSSPECIDIRDIVVSKEGTSALFCPTAAAPEALQRLLSGDAAAGTIADAAGAAAGAASGAASCGRDAGLRLHSPMLGRVQASNMALAILAASLATSDSCATSGACAVRDSRTVRDSRAPTLSPQALATGLSRARQPARFEYFPGLPEVVLDGAHTPDSVALGSETFNALFPGRKILLFACAQDKKHKEMAAILAPFFDMIIVTKPGTFKTSDAEAVYESFRAHVQHRQSLRLIPDTMTAIREALARGAAYGDTLRPAPQAASKAALLITGSFYLCAEAAPLLQAR